MNGLVNIYKEKGLTSQKVVSCVKRILNTRDCGHMGTLDPQGEGVLLVGVGKGTRLFNLLLNKDKVYRAEFTFGYETDTLDADGVMVKESSILPSLQQILDIKDSLIGQVDQIPPLYSAKNINGQRAYDLARRGIKFELKPCPVKIYSINYVSHHDNSYTFDIHCSSGTYIRSICRDLAYKLNTFATMTSIIRLRSGSFTIDKAITLEQLSNIGERAIIPLDDALSFLPRLDIDEQFYTKLRNGIKLQTDRVFDDDFTVYCKGELFGLGKIENKYLSIKTFLHI